MQHIKPELKEIDSFKQALASYHVSDHAKSVLAKSDFLVMTGVAGGGRNTVLNEMAKTGKYAFFVSDTTRPPKLRNGQMEQDGVEYNFRAEADILKDIQNGEFIEAEIIHNQQVSGTSIREFERIMSEGKIPIAEVEYGGVNNIADAKPNAIIIGLLPPSYDEWIRRLRSREELHEDEFMNRLATAEKVLENMLFKPTFKLVVNHEYHECAAEVRSIVEDHAYTESLHAANKQVALELLDKVQEHLSSRAA